MIELDQFSDSEDIRYMWLTKFLLQLCGQWPYTSKLKKLLCRIMIIVVLSNGIPFLTKEFFNRWSTSRLTSLHCFPPVLTMCVCYTKFGNLIAQDAKIRLLLAKLQNSWRITSEVTERNILITYRELAKSTTYLYAGSLYIAMVFFLLTPVTPAMVDIILPLNESRPKHLVYPADYGIPIEDHYTLFLFHHYICTCAAITILVASDLFFVSVVYHACGLFALTRHRIEHVADNITYGIRTIKLEEIYGQNTFDHIFMKRVANSAIYHKRAIEYAELVEQTYTWCLFVVLGINMFLISLTGFQVLTQKDRWDDVLLCSVYIFGQLCHLYLLSLPGQLLKNESGGVVTSLCMSYNYEVPVRAQKMLIPMMVRGMKVNKITAGCLLVMDMETFMSVLQSSASYFTLLANFA